SLYGDGPRRRMGQGYSRPHSQRELELRGLYGRREIPGRREPGRMPRLPQAACERQLHVHAQGTVREEVADAAAAYPDIPDTSPVRVLGRAWRSGLMCSAG